MPPNMNPFGPDHGSSRSHAEVGSSNNGRLAASEITSLDHIKARVPRCDKPLPRSRAVCCGSGCDPDVLVVLQKLAAWPFRHDLIVLAAIEPHLLGTLQNLIDPEDIVFLHKLGILLKHFPLQPNFEAVALAERHDMLVNFLPELFVFNLGNNRSTLFKESPPAPFFEGQLRYDEHGVSFPFGRRSIPLQLQRLCLEDGSFVFFERNLLGAVLLDGNPIYR